MTHVQIAPSEWYGQAAYTLETPHIRLITVPGIGAKIVSLYDKRTDREWLVPPLTYPLQPIAYGATFSDQDMSGWDEIFPTIDACLYPVPGEFEGVRLPDHGEVWALPWSIAAQTGGSLTLSVTGRVLPYRLTRTLSALNDSIIRFDYTAENLSQTPIAILWAAHPQFAVDSATRIVLPDNVTQVISVHDSDKRLARGSLCQWPETTIADQPPLLLDRTSSKRDGQYRKFYVLPDRPVDWAMLNHSSDSSWLRLAWNAAYVPYLGIWIDEAAFSSVYTIALEPTTGFYDDLAQAWQNERVLWLLAGTSHSWHFDLSVGRP